MKTALKVSQKLVVILVTCLVILFLLGSMLYSGVQSELEATYSSASNALLILNDKLTKNALLNEYANSELPKDQQEICRLVASIVSSTPAAQRSACLKELNSYYPGTEFFLLESGGTLRSGGGSLEELSREELDTLGREAVLVRDSYRYFAVPAAGGRLIARVSQSSSLVAQSLFTGISKDLDMMVVEKKTDTITAAKNEQRIGQQLPLTASVLPDRYRSVNDGKWEAMQTCFVTDANGVTQFAVFCDFDEEYRICVCTGYGAIIGSAIERNLIATLLSLVMIVILLVFFFRIRRTADGQPAHIVVVRPFKKLGFDKLALSHMGALLVIALVITGLFSGYANVLSAYTLQNELTAERMVLLNENIAANKKDQAAIRSVIQDQQKGNIRILAKLLELSPSLQTTEGLRRTAEQLGVNAIFLYDGSGTMQASSDGYTGYSLTQNESDTMYSAWEVLQSDQEILTKEYNDGSHRHLTVLKRKGTAGLICLVSDAPLVDSLLAQYSEEEAIRSTDFGNATTFFVRTDDNSTVFRIQPYSATIETASEVYPEEVSREKFTGTAEIAGEQYYVNTRKGNGLTISSAIPMQEIDSCFFDDLLNILIIMAALMLAFGFGCFCKVDPALAAQAAPPVKKVKRRKRPKDLFSPIKDFKTDQPADILFRRAMLLCALAAVAAIAVLMLFSTTRNVNTNLLSYLFTGNWNRGVNIFSLSTIVIMLCVVPIVVFLLRRILALIFNNMDSRGTTLGKLISSLLGLLGGFFVVGFGLYQFGVDPISLLASAGIVGFVVGIAAKDTIADLIAGLFLVFEGNFRVGDWVKVKDWRGEIIEIGARACVIQCDNARKVFNNSTIKEYINLSYENSSVLNEIPISTSADLAAVKQLIENAQPTYSQRIPELISGPWYCNITKTTSKDITLCVMSLVREQDVVTVKRKVEEITFELLRENGMLP